jgi:putative transposase
MIVHLVWSAKYRCSVLTGNKQKRCREVLIEICGVEGVVILKGVVRHDLECRPSQNFSTLIKKLKGRSSRKLQMEFPELKKRYWGLHFWAIGFGCWSAVNITDKMVDEYLEHHRKSSNDTDSFIIA